MRLRELRPGLHRWTAPHPDWEPDPASGSPADWPREVGCVAYEAEDGLVLVDPLVPDELWRELDRLAERHPRVAVLTTIGFHRRSRDEVVRRYGASTSRGRASLPRGVATVPVQRAGETMVWLPEHRALVPGDRLLGEGEGRLRLCPDSWLRYLRNGLDRAELRRALRPLLDLPLELVLVSHGEPVLADGHAALARALEA